MDSVDSNSTVSVARMFEELIRDHAAAEPLPERHSAAPARRTRPPRPPARASRAFWEMSTDEARVAELAVLLAPPDLHALAIPWAAPPHARAGSSIPPVAMPAFVADGQPTGRPAAPYHWLLPASAGVCVLGAVAMTGWLQLQTLRAIHPTGTPSRLAAGATDFSVMVPAAPTHQAAETVEATAAELLREPTADVGEWPESPLTEPSAETRRAAEQVGQLLRSAAGLRSPRVPLRAVAASAPSGASPAAWPRARRARPAPTPETASEPAAAPTADPPFDKGAARSALRQAGAAAAGCAASLQGSRRVPVAVTFAPSGRVTAVQIGGHLAGTAAGSCVARMLRSVRLPPFSGAHVTVTKSLRIK